MSPINIIEQGFEGSEQVSDKEGGEINDIQRLKEIEDLLQQMEKGGVADPEEIEQERVDLELKLNNKLVRLNQEIGQDNISNKSRDAIHQHSVEDVVDFRNNVFDKYQQLNQMRNDLKISLNKEDRQDKDKTTEGESRDPIFEAAKKARTVRDFKDNLSFASDKEADEDEKKILIKAKDNISDIMSGYEDYYVKENLPKVYDVDAAGVTEMGVGGGEEVTISAKHLTDVVTEEGKKDVRLTFKHEEVHKGQTRLQAGDKKTVVVDPKNKRAMTEGEIFEGGAMSGTKELGGEEIANVGNDYKEGLAFYKRNKANIINKHVEKGGQFAGDRVHLQVELAKNAGISNIDELKKLAKKANFSFEEQSKFFKLMNISNSKGDSSMN